MAFPLFHPESSREAPLFLSRHEFAVEFPLESELIERKQGIGQDALQETVVAFSNSQGGIVLFGVRDNGELLGMTLTQRLSDRLHESIAAVRSPGRYAVRTVTVDDTEVAVLAVERRIEGFAQTSNGRILVRVGPRNVALFDSELARFVRERSFQRFDSTDSRVPVAEVATELLDELATAYGWIDPQAVGERLVERGFALDNGNLTVAGLLLLSRRPQEHLGKAHIEVLRFAQDDGGEYDRRITIEGPVTEQIERAVGMVQDELGSEMVIVGVERHDLPRVPLVVLREAIANAVAHRSYEMSGTAVRIEMRPHEVRIVSPGALPPPVTVENMREAQAARNVVLIDALRRLHLAEDAGRGVDVMQDEMRAELLDQPAFVDTGHSVEVTLPTRGPVTPSERAWVREIERRGEIEPGDRILLVHAARGDVLTNQTARGITGLDRVEATRALQRLRHAGFLVQEGERGGSTYRLDGSLSPPAGLRLSRAELRQLILSLAAEGPLTNAVVRARTGLDRAAALRVLDSLVHEGLLKRRGERRGTHYIAVGDRRQRG